MPVRTTLRFHPILELPTSGMKSTTRASVDCGCGEKGTLLYTIGGSVN